MKLRKSEAFCIFDDHHRSIGNIYSDFNYSCCNHDLRFTFYEPLHLKIFVFRFHFSVHNTNMILRSRKVAADGFKPCHEVIQIDLFRFFDQRINNIYLSTSSDFFFKKCPDLQSICIILVYGTNWLSSRRQFINYRNIKVAV